MTNNLNINTNDRENLKIFVLEKEFAIDKEWCRKHFYTKQNKQKEKIISTLTKMKRKKSYKNITIL